MTPTPDAKTGPVRLADIRCETCRWFSPGIEGMADYCIRYSHGTDASWGCNGHPLWQRALAEEQKGGSDAKNE